MKSQQRRMLPYIGMTFGLALNYGLSVEVRKTAMTLFCDIYRAATL